MDIQQLNSSIGTHLDMVSDLALLGSAAIWGIGISQTFRFCIKAGREPKALKIFVSWICAVDTLRQIFTTYSGITLYFNTEYLFRGKVSPGCILMPYLCSALVAGSAQSFFAYRLWIVSDFKWFIPVLVAPAVLLQLSIPPVYFRSITSDAISTETQKDLLITSLVVGAITDILLSAGLCSLLWGHSVTTSSILRPTKAMLQRLMIFSINTGMWTALLATSIVIVFFRTGTEDFMVFGYFHLLSPLYFTTVLANLNVRRYLHVTGEISLTMSGTNTNSEMQFAQMDDVLDRFSFRGSPSLRPPSVAWGFRNNNPSSEALNPHLVESPLEEEFSMKDEQYVVVAL